jgi:hypothetical protein
MIDSPQYDPPDQDRGRESTQIQTVRQMVFTNEKVNNRNQALDDCGSHNHIHAQGHLRLRG